MDLVKKVSIGGKRNEYRRVNNNSVSCGVFWVLTLGSHDFFRT